MTGHARLGVAVAAVPAQGVRGASGDGKVVDSLDNVERGVRGTASIARSFMGEEKEACVLALYQTHLAILDYALRSGLQRVLLLEDDAIFHADFPRVFDERVRIVAGRPFLRTKRHPWLSTFAYSRPAPLLPYESQISHFERPTRLHFASGRTSSRTF